MTSHKSKTFPGLAENPSSATAKSALLDEFRKASTIITEEARTTKELLWIKAPADPFQHAIVFVMARIPEGLQEPLVAPEAAAVLG